MNKSKKKNILLNWKTESCFKDHEEIIPELILQINKAEVSIDFEMYIFDLDTLGNEIIKLLAQASLKGVRVRLLVDGIGSSDFNSKVIKRLFQDYKIEVKIYKPISSWVIKTIISIFHMNWDEVKLYFISMNHRDHRKIAVFDNKLLMIGSANISQSHSNWREIMVEVSGDNINCVIDKFNEVWSKSSNFSKKTFKLYNNIRTRHQYKVSRIDLINKSKNLIKMVNPYFIPPYSLLAPLIRASRRGVKVEFMISKKCDVMLMSWFYRQYYKLLIYRNIDIYEHQSKFLHTKIMIIDDQAIVGSSNYNYRSVNLDLELDILVKSPEVLKKLNNYWTEDLILSKLISKPVVSRWDWILKRLKISKRNF